MAVILEKVADLSVQACEMRRDQFDSTLFLCQEASHIDINQNVRSIEARKAVMHNMLEVENRLASCAAKQGMIT